VLREGVDAPAVELRAGMSTQLVEGVSERHRAPVLAIAGHRVEGIGDQQNP
jgi:hypothetical protein